MKLSEYAKINNVTYRTAWNRYKSGLIPGAYKNEFGTIIVPEIDTRPEKSDVEQAIPSDLLNFL